MPPDNFTLARELLVNAIRPALSALGKGGLAEEQLLLGTAIQESLLIHRQQLGGGPALGLFQMETTTHDDCWKNYLNFRGELATKVKQTLKPGEEAAADTMRVNDCYAAAICRIRYLRAPAALPVENDNAGMANYWKQHYNTPQGEGKPEQFLAKWSHYVNAHTFD